MKSHYRVMSAFPLFARAVALLLILGAARAQSLLSGEALVKTLRQAGYVIVMRHASSPRDWDVGL